MNFLLLDRDPVESMARFVGRAEELAALDILAGQQPALGVLSGAGGVGKTALALHWGQTRASGFPAGVTYVDLDGRCGEEMSRLALREFGVPDRRIPGEARARAQLYRATVTGRRLLILDNVREAAHVREALPADPKVMVLAISRDALPGLTLREHARQIRVEPLPMRDAVRLLETIAGAGKPGLERLASRCDRVPLALHIMGSCLAEEGEEKPNLPAWEMGGEGDGVWVALDASYRRLDPDAARVLRIIATLPVPSVSIPYAASVCALSEPDAGRVMETLSRRHLMFVQPPGGKGYRMHDLVRLYALDRANAEDSPLGRTQCWAVPPAGFPGTKEMF